MNELDVLVESPAKVVSVLDDDYWESPLVPKALARPDVRAYLVEYRWPLWSPNEATRVGQALHDLGFSLTVTIPSNRARQAFTCVKTIDPLK